MRATSGHIWDVWNAGGAFVGARGKPHTRVTVEVGWELEVSTGAVGVYPKLPIRWFQRADSSQVETEVPNIRKVSTQRSLEQDAATATITVVNQQMPATGDWNTASDEFGNQGYYTYTRGETAASGTLWGHATNSWHNVLAPNALLRTYQGYGGNTKTRAQALSDGNIIQTGIWLVDEVRISTAGDLELVCRDMAKLVIDQPVYPPLVPDFDTNGCTVYPLAYSRERLVTGTRQDGVISYGLPNMPSRSISGFAFARDTIGCRTGEGYWMAGTDGGVFNFGYLEFHGSRGSGEDVENQVIVGIAARHNAQGNWLVGGDGGVYSFGDAAFYGSLPELGITADNVTAIETSAGGNGYYIFRGDGAVYAFGDAVYYGNALGIAAAPIIAGAVHPAGGYWLMSSQGHVYAFGAAIHLGNVGQNVTGMCATPSGNGYWAVKADGAVYSFGDAVYQGGANTGALNDEVTDIDCTPDGGGYWLCAKDGGIFSFGNARFYGSLPGSSYNNDYVNGNFLDLSDIVRDLLYWSGWWLYPATETGRLGHDENVTRPVLFGNLEDTGIISDDGAHAIMDETMFDKLPVIDVINKIKAVLGWNFYVDGTGAIHFEPPNIWGPGNFVNGIATAVIPEIDESKQILSYSMGANDRNMRTSITLQILGKTPVTRPSRSAAGLRGISRPFVWPMEFNIRPEEMQTMAELIDVRITMRARAGQVSAPCLPLLEIDDQVRILERQTSETQIHYVRSIATEHDLEGGSYTMALTTSAMGTDGAWGIYAPSKVVSLHPIRTRTTVPTAKIFPPKPAMVRTWTSIPMPVIVTASPVTTVVTPTVIAAVSTLPLASVLGGATAVTPTVIATVSTLPPTSHTTAAAPSVIATTAALPTLQQPTPNATVTPFLIETHSFVRVVDSPMTTTITPTAIATTLAMPQLDTPNNDNFAGARNIFGTFGIIEFFSLADMTAEVGEPDPFVYGPTNSRWWRWTAPITAEFAFDGPSQNAGDPEGCPDDLMFVYTGSSLEDLTLVCGNDDAPEWQGLGGLNRQLQPVCTFDATEGVTYYIQYWSKEDPFPAEKTAGFTWNTVPQYAVPQSGDTYPKPLPGPWGKLQTTDLTFASPSKTTTLTNLDRGVKIRKPSSAEVQLLVGSAMPVNLGQEYHAILDFEVLGFGPTAGQGWSVTLMAELLNSSDVVQRTITSYNPWPVGRRTENVYFIPTGTITQARFTIKLNGTPGTANAYSLSVNHTKSRRHKPQPRIVTTVPSPKILANSCVVAVAGPISTKAYPTETASNASIFASPNADLTMLHT